MEAGTFSLLEELAPITQGIGFLKAPLSVLDDVVLPWQHSLGRKIISERIHLPLSDALRRLEPLSSSTYKNLWVETNSPWLACFSNHLQGGGQAVRHLAKKAKTYAVVVSYSAYMISEDRPEKEKGTWGDTQFALYGPDPRPILNDIRTVMAANDGGRWVFHAAGEVQPFEQIERYNAPRIPDRFTPQMLRDYCLAMGIDVFNESFYRASAVLLTQDYNAWKNPPRLLTLAERKTNKGS